MHNFEGKGCYFFNSTLECFRHNGCDECAVHIRGIIEVALLSRTISLLDLNESLLVRKTTEVRGICTTIEVLCVFI